MMNLRPRQSLRSALCAAALCAGTAAAAPEPIPWTYLDVELISVDAGPGDETGFGVDGSYAFDDLFYGVAGISDVDTTTSLSIGAGLRGELGPKVHAFGELLLITLDAGGIDDTGYEIGIGLRGLAAQKLELFARVDHVDFGTVSDQALTVGAVRYFDRFGISAAFTSNDSADAFAIGIRLDL
jgi:hypothetical protein